MQCKYLEECKPNEQRKKEPFGTEWVWCQREQIFKHCFYLNCTYVPIRDENGTLSYNNFTTEEEIINAYKRNKSIKETSRDLCCSYSHVVKVLKRNSLYKRPVSKKEILENHKDMLLFLREKKGMQYLDIVFYVNKNYGIQITTTTIGDLIREWQKERGN